MLLFCDSPPPPAPVREDALMASVFLLSLKLLTGHVSDELRSVAQIDLWSPCSCHGCDLTPPCPVPSLFTVIITPSRLCFPAPSLASIWKFTKWPSLPRSPHKGFSPCSVPMDSFAFIFSRGTQVSHLLAWHPLSIYSSVIPPPPKNHFFFFFVATYDLLRVMISLLLLWAGCDLVSTPSFAGTTSSVCHLSLEPRPDATPSLTGLIFCWHCFLYQGLSLF